MSLYLSIYQLSGLADVIAEVIVLYYVFLAFRRTGGKAFLIMTIGCVLNIFIAVCDHTIGIRLHLSNGNIYIAFKLVRYGLFFVALILWVAGTVLLVRPYLSDSASKTK